MVKRSLILSFFFLATRDIAQARPHCYEINDLAKEAVAYSLLGAWMPFADHACFKGRHFKYFKPEVAHREGEVTNWDNFIWFDQAHDKYSIVSVRPDGAKYLIKVRLTMKGKARDTTFIYEPSPDYTKRTGICGFVTNPTDQIVRKDCADQVLAGPHIR